MLWSILVGINGEVYISSYDVPAGLNDEGERMFIALLKEVRSPKEAEQISYDYVKYIEKY